MAEQKALGRGITSSKEVGPGGQAATGRGVDGKHNKGCGAGCLLSSRCFP